MCKQRIVKSLIFCVLAGVLFVQGAFAQQQNNQVAVQARTDTTRIRIGEQVQLELSARLKNGYRVAFPQLPDTFSHWEVVSRSALDTAGNESEKHFRQVITITSFDSGHWVIPPLKFEVFSAATGTYDSIFSQPLGIDVNTVKVDTTKAFQPIKTIRTVPWNPLVFWLIVIGGLLLIWLVLGIYLYYKNRRKKAPAPPPAPAITPYENAVQQLYRLKEEKVWQQGDIKQYYTRLTDILRTYFEQQFKIPALEQTSEELLGNIRPVTILNQQRDKLRALLAIADLAKFAKLQPTPDEHEDSMQKAVEIVEWTRPAVEKAEAGNGAPAAEKAPGGNGQEKPPAK